MKIAVLIVICLVFFALILLASCKSKKEESLFPIEVDGQMGYIDKTGKVVINPQFDDVGEFSEGGLARVRIGYKHGYVDKTGKIVWMSTE